MHSIDIGEYCVECYHSVAFGSGRFVNRIPADRCEGINYLHRDGYLCPECVAEYQAQFEREQEAERA